MDAASVSPALDAFRGLWRCVGRERELALLEGLQTAAYAEGRGRIAYVAGPAGIGKSCLTQELRRRLGARGVLVADGSCGEGAAPWQPALEIIAQVLRALAESGAGALSVRGAEVLGALRGRGEESARGRHADQGREALCERAAAFLTDASRVAPLCIVINDLHFADGTTRALVRHLAQTRFPMPELEAPVEDRLRGLLLVTSREAEADWLDGTAFTELPLGPLDEEGVRDFLQSPEVVRLIAEATGGRPRALETLLETTLPDGDQQLLARMELLSQSARRLLEALAVIDRPTPPDLLRRVAGGTGEPSLALALDELSGARVIVRRVMNGELRVAFAPAGIGATAAASVRRTIDEASAAALHLAVGRELLATGHDAELATAAEHLLAGGGGEQAVDVALAAGEQLEAGFGHERAIALYRAAHAATSRDAVRARLEQRLVELQRLTGDYEGALADAERLRARRPDDPATLRAVGQLHLARDEYPAAREALARARESALRRGDRLELARVIASFAEVCLLDGRHQDATAECEIGLHATGEVDATSGDPDGAPHALHASTEALRLRLEIRNTLGKVHLAEGRYEAAEALFDRNLDEARAHGLGFEEARARINQGIARLRLGDHEAAAGCYQAALKVATAAGDHRHRAFCLQNLGVLAHWKAEYGTALRYFHDAVGAFKRIGQRGRLAWLALDLASLYLELGALARAESMASLAERLGDRAAGPMVRHKLAVIGARIRRGEGELDAARTLLERACADSPATTAPELHAEAAILLGWVELEAGDPARAARVLTRTEAALVATPPSLGARARLALLGGEVRLALGEAGSARRALMEAAESFQQLGDLDGEWRAHFALGRVAAATGDHAEAERRNRRAAQIDARLRERVPEELRPHLAEDPARRALTRTLAEIASATVRLPLAATTVSSSSGALDDRRGAVPGPGDRYERLIGAHPRMRQIYALVDKVARHQSVVLIRGESGTGKELIAEAVHLRSTRSAEALVKVNCGALVETLLLSELFGHERGAFTGAVQRKKGRFEAADRGTIFLDEIGDISPQTQAALLRVIQEREFERVGSTTPIKVDVRIICATNRDLEAMVAAGEFREDLYYRLKGIQIDLPPLRERAEDIPLIAADILARVIEERGDGPRSISAEAMERMQRYRWPGNVRELENVIRSVTLFAEGSDVTLEDLREHPEILASGAPTPVTWRRESVERASSATREVEGAAWERLGAEGIGLRELQEKIEIECITRALAESGGNITRAAEILKMKRPRLSQLIKEHGIALPRDEGTSCGQP